MKEFKGYDYGNEKKDLIIRYMRKFFEILNKREKFSGDISEDKILDKHNAVDLSELSTSTLVKEYDNLMG